MFDYYDTKSQEDRFEKHLHKISFLPNYYKPKPEDILFYLAVSMVFVLVLYHLAMIGQGIWQSHHKTVKEARAQFIKLPDVPEWHIVKSN